MVEEDDIVVYLLMFLYRWERRKEAAWREREGNVQIRSFTSESFVKDDRARLAA